MRWLVTGSEGMLGRDMVAALSAADEEVTATTKASLDVTSPASVSRVVDRSYDAIVNCAAWTQVDAAEAHEDLVRAVNTDGPRLLAAAARSHGSVLVQLSTDYVFDGLATAPYDEDSVARPMSVYGQTKHAGEEAVRQEHPDGHLVVRTAWLYGAHGSCFPKTILRLSRESGSVKVVADQWGQPTFTADVAELVVRLVQSGARGTFHATSSGQTTWYSFARAVVESAGLDPSRIERAESATVARAAARPSYSVLGHDALARAGVPGIGHWLDRWRVAAPLLVEKQG